MTKLFLDFETASVLDVREVGVHNYATHGSTRPLMLGWAFDDDEASLWEPHTGPMPAEVQKALQSDVNLLAWNVPFERAIFHRCLQLWLDYPRWTDIMIWSRHLSLPGSLEKAGPAIGLPQNLVKNKDGKRLINKFSQPFHKGGEETLFGISEPRFHNWEDEPADWKLFGDYCKQDVVTEREIFKIVSNIPLPESERRGWILDQKINDRGLPVNRKFVQNALTLSLKSKEQLTKKLKEMTGLANPNSRDQFLGWATGQKYPFLSLGKNFVKAALADDSPITPELRTALKIRQEASKTSYTKFETILNFLSSDDRLRDQYAYMGGARTGRWAGKDAQVQNQARPMKEVEAKYERAIEIINACDYEAAEKEFPSVIGMTISCIRSSFQATT